MRRRAAVPQRTLYFAGCEGDGERAYIALLNKLAGERRLHVWIHGEPLNPGAGDPLALVQRAAERLAHKRRQGAVYRQAVVFLDADTSSDAPERTQRAQKMATTMGLHLIWQRPNLEAVLLRHLEGCQSLHPPADQSLVELRRRWPDYDKSGISADRMAHRIGFEQVVQAAKVESELAEFLRIVSFI